jgi:hypothetical protein
MPSVCSRKVAHLEWPGVRKGENVLQPFNLCDRLLGIHSASIFTRSASPKESGKPQFRSRAAVEKVEELLNRPKLTQVAENWKTGSLLIQ